MGEKPKSIEEQLAETGEVMTSSAGTSMYPMLRNRKDMIVIESVKRTPKRNDVPLYRLASGKLVLHRILSVKDGMYIIRGDNLFAKEYVKPEQVVGLLKAFYREGKFYDCATSRKYKCYVFYVRASYPFRHFWHVILHPALAKCKHAILRDKK